MMPNGMVLLDIQRIISQSSEGN
jgi:hypothetical protein